MAKEYGSLSMEQQGKLMREIDNLEKLGDDEEAQAVSVELRRFIQLLHHHGFIGSDKACRYRQGVDFSMERRRKRQEATV